MEKYQDSILLKMLVTNKLVLSKILEFFGYAHQNMYLLHCLCQKTRSKLFEINQTLKLFFSNTRYKCKIIKEGLDCVLETDDLNNPITDYIDLHIRYRLPENLPITKVLDIRNPSIIKRIRVIPEVEIGTFLVDLKADLKAIKQKSPDVLIDVNLKQTGEECVIGNLAYRINTGNMSWKAFGIDSPSST